jgi:hypothetical protein
MKNPKVKTVIVVMIAIVASTLDMDKVMGFSRELSRRQSFEGVATVATVLASHIFPPVVLPANAVVDEETPRIVTRMGGLLVS